MSAARDERLADWLDERLSAAEQAEFERDQAADPELRQDAERYRWTVDQTRAAFGDDARAPDNLVDAVMTEIDAGSRRGHGHIIGWAVGAITAIAATTLVFLNVATNPPSNERPVAKAPSDSVRPDASAPGEDDSHQNKEARAEPDLAFETQLRRLEPNAAKSTGGVAALVQEAGDAEQEQVAEEVVRAVQQELARQQPTVDDYFRAAPSTAAGAPQQMVFLATIDTPTLERLWQMRDPGSVAGNVKTDPVADLPSVLTTPELLGWDNARLGLRLAAVPQSAMRNLEEPQTESRTRAQTAAGATAYLPAPTDQVFRVTGSPTELPIYFSRLKQQLTAQGQQLEVQWAPAEAPPAASPTSPVAPPAEDKRARKSAGTADRSAAEASVLLILRTPPTKR